MRRTLSSNASGTSQKSRPASNRRRLYIRLIADERDRLNGIVDAPSTTPSNRLRAVILLMSDDGVAPAEIARFVGVKPNIVSVYRTAYVRHGLDAVMEAPVRHKFRRKYGTDIDAAVLKIARTDPPKGVRWWTYRRIALEVGGVSADYVAKIIRAAGIDLKAGRRIFYRY